MLRLHKIISAAFSAVAVSAALVACGGGGGTSGSPVTPVANVTFISGTVQTNAGAAVAGASVSAAGQTAVTGSDGGYKFDASAAGDRTVVLVKKSGFTTTAKDVPLTTGKTTQMDIKLFADQVSTTFNSANAASIAVNGASVTLVANAVKSASGADFTGTVAVGASYYSPDTALGAQAFAGPYTGVNGAAESPLITMGFMEVKLTDAATGNALQLKTGAAATLTFPSSSNSGTATSVPLWFYDEAAKIWKREGQATRQSNGTYQGSVAHFTIWNADFPGVRATIKGCFVNSAGQAVTNVGSAELRTTGWSHWIGGFNPDGNFTVLAVPANLPMELYSTVTPASFATVTIPALAPGEVRQLPCSTATAVVSTGNNVINLPTGVFIPPVPGGTGPANPTPTTPAAGTASFAGIYTGTYGGAEVGTFNVSVSNAGVITGQATSTTFQGLVSSVSGQVSGSGGVTLNATAGTAGSARFIGSITATGALSGTWVYVGTTSGGTFSGQRS
jgi:Carboxypeptidase regulatory-like domain